MYIFCKVPREPNNVTILYDLRSVTVESRLLLIKFFEHTKLTPVLDVGNHKMGFSMNMREFLETMSGNHSRRDRMKNASTQTDMCEVTLHDGPGTIEGTC